MMIRHVFLAVALLFTHNQCQSAQNKLPDTVPARPVSLATTNDGRSKIQVALLLDTSNSMDGLIDQAKAQLWKMVNKLASAQQYNQQVDVEIALFEYGKQTLPRAGGYIRKVQDLNTDLDGLSEKLFELKTNGGDEFCGYVIQSAIDSIKWSDNPQHLKVIVIAGNEPFNQGPIDFRTSCEHAAARGILVNTIFCGNLQEGIDTRWQEGALIGKGRYMNIDSDKKVVHINTPYDTTVLRLNQQLNSTYIGYGSKGKEYKMRQEAQDSNAGAYGSANVAQRAAAKSKGTYQNDDWDLVDAAKKDAGFVDKMEESEMPEAWKGMSKADIKKEIENQQARRAAIQKQLLDLEVKINDYIAEEQKKQAGSTAETLDNVLIQAVVEQARALGYSF
jgi:hypothetical protein